MVYRGRAKYVRIMIQMIWGQIMKDRSPLTLNVGRTTEDQSSDSNENAEGQSASLTRIHARVDRAFCMFAAVQSASIVAVAMLVTPSTWLGYGGMSGLSIWLPLTLGVFVCIAPSALSILFPGQPIVRHAFAVAHAAWAAILIHLCGGAAAVHVCILVSIALLSLYRDFRVLATASFIAAADYLIRSSLWPESLYGERTVLPYQWLEHLNWLVITTGFFAMTSYRSRREIEQSCTAQVALRTVRAELASRDLADLERQQASADHANATDATATVSELDEASPSHDALSADSESLQTITALLRRISFSVNLLHEKATKSRVTALVKASQTLTDRKNDLAEYLTNDSRGTHFPSMLSELANRLSSERNDRQQELETIQETVQSLSQLIGSAVTPQRELDSCDV